MTIILHWVLFLLVPNLGFGADFNETLQAFQDGNFESAQQSFQELLTENPGDPILLYNLGQTHYKLGKKGLALGLWRQSLFKSKNIQVQKAIEFVESEMGVAKEKSLAPAFLSQLFAMKTPYWLVLLSCLTLGVGWFAIHYFIKLKVSILQTPSWFLGGLMIWLLVAILTGLSGLSSQKQYGTIIEPDISFRTGPSSEAPSLYTAQEGRQVEIIKSHEDWLQVADGETNRGWVQNIHILKEQESQ